jgi:hypothetical protein
MISWCKNPEIHIRVYIPGLPARAWGLGPGAHGRLEAPG